MKSKNITSILIITLLILVLGGLTGYYLIDKKMEAEKLSKLNGEPVTTTQTKEIKQEENKSKIVCIGDSLTLSKDGTKSYPEYLKELTHLETETFGGNKLSSQDIAARLNAYSLYVNNVTIPASKTAVTIEIINNNGTVSSLLRDKGSSYNPVTIAGIKGTIKYNSDTKTYKFTRDKAGNEKVISKKTKIEINSYDFKDDDVVILFTGTYDPIGPYSIDNLVTFNQNIINKYKLKNYIVVSLTAKDQLEDIEATNKALKDAFGDQYLDFRSYILENGLSEAGITATDEDQANLTDGNIPNSLRIDDINGNSKFNELLAQQLKKKMITLGYIYE